MMAIVKAVFITSHKKCAHIAVLYYLGYYGMYPSLYWIRIRSSVWFCMNIVKQGIMKLGQPTEVIV